MCNTSLVSPDQPVLCLCPCMPSNAADFADSAALYACFFLCMPSNAAELADSAATYTFLSLCMPSDARMWVWQFHA